MIKEGLKGALRGLFWFASIIWFPPLMAYALIRLFPWHCGMVFSLVSGGFLLGFSVGKYDLPDWVAGGGVFLIIVGIALFLMLSHKELG